MKQLSFFRAKNLAGRWNNL